MKGRGKRGRRKERNREKSVEKGGRGRRRRFLALLAGKGQKSIRGRQTGGDWNGVFPRRVLLLVFVFQREYLRMKERTTTREVHTLTPWESLITASLAGCMNVGLTLPIWTVVAKMQVAPKTPNDATSAPEDDESENEDGAHKWSAVKTKNNRKGCEVVSRVNTRRRNEEKAKARILDRGKGSVRYIVAPLGFTEAYRRH